MDHIDLIHKMTDLRIESLRLDQGRLKVFDFHPNLVFINARSNDDYLASKPFYHDVERLAAMRQPGRGIRTLFFELLDFVAARPQQTMPLRDACELMS